MAVAPLVGSLASKYGTQRFMAAGMTIQTVSLGWFAAIAGVHTPYIELCVPLVLSGIGIGMVFPTVSAEVMSSVPPEQIGIASGANTTIREIGGVFGVALVSVVFAHPAAYTSGTQFLSGFTPAMWACVAFTGIGAIVAASGLKSLRPRVFTPTAASAPLAASH